MHNNILGIKELRQNLADVSTKVARGRAFVVVRRSKPLFKIVPLEDEGEWETVVDFTKIRKGGVPLQDILARL